MTFTPTTCRSWFWVTSDQSSTTSQRVSYYWHQRWVYSQADKVAEALICDINTDVKVALRSLARPEWAKYANHPYLTGPPGGSQGFNA